MLLALGLADPAADGLTDGHGVADGLLLALPDAEAVPDGKAVADAEAAPVGVGDPLIALFEGDAEALALPVGDGVGLSATVGVQGVEAWTRSC